MKFRDFVNKDFKLFPVDFPNDQYFKTIHDKHQIVLHHTASGRGVSGDISSWLGNTTKVATCVIINYNGDIYQAFSSKYWGYHIGVSGRGNNVASEYKLRENRHWYDKHSIGIEIDNWGQLDKINSKYYTWTGKELPKERVQMYPDGFRGIKYYEKYTDEQIDCVVQLVKWFCYKYDIPRTFNESVFRISEDALDRMPGIYTHCSYRTDKTDIHPQEELIEALKSITGSQI